MIPSTTHPDNLTSLGERLLKILSRTGTWMTRSEIAAQLGRPHNELTMSDWRLLRELSTAGLLHMGLRKHRASKQEYIYKAN